MNSKVVGVILIIVGAALAVWGYNIYDSGSSQVSRALSGDTPIEAWAGMVGGAISVLLGISKLK
jgi:hypothetical protein